jgi:hypothetical protein
MRRRFVLGVALLVGSLGTGCPELYGKEGYLDDAMRKDIKEQERERRREQGIPEPCPDGRLPAKECKGSGSEMKCHWTCP